MVVDDFTRDFKMLSKEMTEEDLCNAIQNAFKSDTNAFTMKYYAEQLRTSIIRPGYLFKTSSQTSFWLTKSIRLPDMKAFSQQFFIQMKIFALIQGNLSEAAAKSIMQTVETNLRCGKIEDVSFELFDSLQILMNNYY